MNEQMLNIKFVGEVEKHACLYNYELQDYSRKDITEKAWNEVGEIVNLTGSECRDKWKNLRAVFVRHMKAAPSGSAIKKKKPYYLSEAMQFTKPYIKTLTQSISENLPEISREEQDVSEVHEDDEYLGSLQQTPSQSQSSRQYEPERQSQHQKPPQQTESLPKTRFGSKRKRIMTEFDKSLLDYYKAKKAYLESHSGDGHGSDARKMFLLSLLPEINVMTDEQMRIFKRKVLYLIDKIMPTTSPTTYLPAPDIFMSSQTTTSSTPHV